MSTDTEAYLKVTRPGLTAASVLVAIESSCPHTNRLVELYHSGHYGHYRRPCEPHWAEEPRAHLHGNRWSVFRPPLSFSGTDHIASLYLALRHPEFARDPRLALIRAAVAELAALVGTDRVIYKPELCGDDAGDWDQLERSLRDRFGPPSPTLPDLLRASDAARDYYHPGCWYTEAIGQPGD